MNIQLTKYLFTTLTLTIFAFFLGVNPVSAKVQAFVCHAPGTPEQETLDLHGADIGIHIGHGDVYGECVPLVNTAPVITRLGDKKIKLTVGDTFVDPGVTAYDTEDGDISSNVVVGGDIVDTSVKGKYVITYNVMDSYGVSSEQVKRKVIVKKQKKNKNK